MFNKFKSAGKLTKITLIVILAGILLRFIIASYTIEGGDPCYHASAARFVGRNFHYPLYEYLGREIFAHEPLFHFFGGLFYFVFEKFGMGDFGIHMVAPLFGSLIIIFTYFICKKLLDKRKTLYAMIFVSFIPLEIYHSTTTHIDIVSAFFAILSFYLLLEKKFYLASISFGLTLLGRINGLFIAPVLAYMIFSNYRKNWIRKVAIFFIMGTLIASPWYIRNYELLHNPIWPFLNTFFNGTYHTGHDLKPDKLSQIFDFRDGYVEVHLAFFGVPDGKFANLFIFKDSLFKLALYGWAIFTIISMVPFIMSFSLKNLKDKKFQLMLFGLAPFLFFLYFYQFSYGNTSTRYMLHGVPFMAVLWAYGLENIGKMSRIAARFIPVFLIAFIVCFAAAEAVKSAVITHQWIKLDKDINWAQQNISKNSLIIVPGQCLGYRLDRNVYPAKGSGYDLIPSRDPPINEVSYIFNINNIVQGPIKDTAMQAYLPYFQKVYENNSTNVRIYKKK